MNIALMTPLAQGWGMHNGGWWILGAVVMMLFMGAMMWMVMRGMGGRSSRDSSAPRATPNSGQSPIEALERRFAEGEISTEEYRERREALIQDNGRRSGHQDERLAVPRSGVGGQLP